VSRPKPPPPPEGSRSTSDDRLDGAVRYASSIERRRARSRRRPALPRGERLPTTLEALTRGAVASECITQALRRVRELKRSVPGTAAEAEALAEARGLELAEEHLAEAGSRVVRALAELDRVLGRPTFLDPAAAGDADEGGR